MTHVAKLSLLVLLASVTTQAQADLIEWTSGLSGPVPGDPVGRYWQVTGNFTDVGDLSGTGTGDGEYTWMPPPPPPSGSTYGNQGGDFMAQIAFFTDNTLATPATIPLNWITTVWHDVNQQRATDLITLDGVNANAGDLVLDMGYHENYLTTHPDGVYDEDTSTVIANPDTDMGERVFSHLFGINGAKNIGVLKHTTSGLSPGDFSNVAFGFNTAAIPEPSAFALLGLVAFGAIAYRRRKLRVEEA